MPVDKTADLERFEDAPLRLALVQVRTSPMFAVDRPEAVEGLASAIASEWVLIDGGHAQRIQMQITSAGITQAPEESERLWRFETADGRYTATLTPTSLGLETGRYGDFDEFYRLLQQLLEALAGDAAFQPRIRTRLGVRYVNELHDERLASDDRRAEVVHRELLGPAAALGTDLIASLQELRFKQRDGVLAVRHGMTSPNQYLLDTDHYDDDRRAFDSTGVAETVRAWHDTIEGVFAWAFEPWLRDRGALT